VPAELEEIEILNNDKTNERKINIAGTQNLRRGK
jgi:hypothetical protein